MWSGLVWAALAAPVIGLVWARIAQVVQPHFAPLLLFPLLVGALVGASFVGFMRVAQFGNRPTIFAAVVWAAVVAGTGQHVFAYLSKYYWSNPSVPAVGGGADYQSAQEVAATPQKPARQPAPTNDLAAAVRQLAPSLGGYLAAQAEHGRPLWGDYRLRGCAAWLSWAIDVLLTVGAAVAVTMPAARVPYCNQCRSWYRTVRNGKIDVVSATRLAAILEVEPPERPRSPRYRLSCCHGGCGPTRCELSWEEPRAVVDLVRVWLTADQRGQVVDVLDELASERHDRHNTNDE